MAFTSSYIFRLLLLAGALMALCNLLLFHKLHDDSTHQQQLPLLLPSFSSSCQTIRTLQDIQNCYPNKKIRTLPPHCNTIDSWDKLQQCLTGRFTPHTQDHYTLHILGERNSGTKWLQTQLQQCFPRNNNNTTTTLNVKAHRDFIRSKHFFQPLVQTDFSNSILITVFRDPVQWVAAMREAPYHSPRHLLGFNNTNHNQVIPMPWHDFVTTTWATKRTAFDLNVIRQDRILAETLLLQQHHADLACREQFALYQVVPCRFNASVDRAIHDIPAERVRGYEPIYELRRDDTGRPFRNILELRREKILHFALELPLLMRLGGYAAVRYEDMLTQGTRYIIEQVAEMIGVKELPAECRPTGPQPERLAGRRWIEPDFRAFVEEHVDESMERLLGYKS